jgi:hypothetical protein
MILFPFSEIYLIDFMHTMEGERSDGSSDDGSIGSRLETK